MEPSTPTPKRFLCVVCPVWYKKRREREEQNRPNKSWKVKTTNNSEIHTHTHSLVMYISVSGHLSRTVASCRELS